jgi:PAS domain S-box-containing protein
MTNDAGQKLLNEHEMHTEVKSSPPKSDYGDLVLDAICAVDADSRCLSVKGACERIFGYTPEEMVGKYMLDLVHPEDRNRTEQSIDRVMGGYLQRYFENRYIRKDGSVVYISWSASWSEEHQVRIGVARDITDRKFDHGEIVAPQLIPEYTKYWQLSASPRRLISPNGVSIALSEQDHIVLLALMSGGECVTRKSIVSALGEDYIEYDQRRLDTQMNRLRRKVEDASGQRLPVSTLRSIGYRFHEQSKICP